MIHLDASFLIRMAREESKENRVWRELTSSEIMVVSAMAWAEFLCGPVTASEWASALRCVDDYREMTPRHAETAAYLFNNTGRRRRSLADCLIAAAAIHDGARLATSNTKDFRRFADAGLRLV